MKKCPYCGKEYPDEMMECPSDANRLVPLNAQGVQEVKAMPQPEELNAALMEQRFWETMTFRGLALFYLRMQALWFLFDGLLAALNVITYLCRLHVTNPFSTTIPELRNDVFTGLLRLSLYCTLGLLVLLHAEKILSWVVRDWVTKFGEER